MTRERIRGQESGGLYLPTTSGPARFSSGCALLDCVLGGGWPRGRVVNVVGDYSTGKTLLAIEACANFARTVPDGRIVYIETEAAFDADYAQSVGLPLDRVLFPNDPQKPKERIDTVEKLIRYNRTLLESSKGETLVVVDSMDALSDEAEMERDPEKGSYGAAKPKLLSEFFRTQNAPMADKGFTLFIVSQVRDAIGVTWGKKTRRSGGKALDFYAALVVWLARTKQIAVTRKKVERTIGVRIRARAEKSKVGPPFRDCEFPIYFNYGIEDVEAACDWLEEIGRGSLTKGYLPAELAGLDPKAYRAARAELGKIVREEWTAVEDRFRPVRSKY